MSDSNQIRPLGAPIWLADNPLIQRLLNRFIDICDRPSAVQFSERINPTKWPELFDFSDDNHEFLWKLIEDSLGQEYNIIEHIKYQKNAGSEEYYNQAMLYFNRQQEDLVRYWLARPKTVPYADQWQLAIEHYPHFKSTSLSQKIQVKGFSAGSIVSGFNQVRDLINELDFQAQDISLRGLSARCFWGDSKFLDKRRKLICDVFPKAKTVVRERTIMMSAYVPENIKHAIFVENFDSFLTLIEALKQSSKTQSTAIIYSAGYRGSAGRIRDMGHSQFLYINVDSSSAHAQFYDWWYRRRKLQIHCYFWGDLDFEGISILRTLRNNFPEIQAWRQAYSLMVDFHNQGLGHLPQQAGKEKQPQPSQSGCDYTDTVLLPLLINSKRFIDQEVINKAQLMKILDE